MLASVRHTDVVSATAVDATDAPWGRLLASKSEIGLEPIMGFRSLVYAVQSLVNRTDPVYFSARFHRTPAGKLDLAVAQIEWHDGLLASFAASYLTPEGMPPRGFDRMEVFGAGWSARIHPNPRPIEVWGDRAFWPMALEIRTDDTGASGMLAEELRGFCRVVRGQQIVPMGATYSDALQVQQWMDRLAAGLNHSHATF